MTSMSDPTYTNLALISLPPGSQPRPARRAGRYYYSTLPTVKYVYVSAIHRPGYNNYARPVPSRDVEKAGAL